MGKFRGRVHDLSGDRTSLWRKWSSCRAWFEALKALSQEPWQSVLEDHDS